MNIIPYPKTIYIVEGDADHSRSLRCLLENHDRVVRVFDRYEDFLVKNTHRENDIVLLNFRRQCTSSFDILNRLLFSTNRPEIVITTDETSVFQPSDQFLGDRVTILFHPYTPRELIEAIDLVGIR